MSTHEEQTSIIPIALLNIFLKIVQFIPAKLKQKSHLLFP